MSVTRAAWSLVGMLVVTASVSAQTPPPLVRFAGAVPASAGAVPGGPATLTFAVYADQQGGTPLWTETQTVTLDAEGRYAVVLGATQPAGLPVELFTSGEARWLGVTVAQGPEAPRVLLVSVPYALKAADATTVAGKPLSAFVLAGDKTGTGADGLTYVNTQALSIGLQGAGGPVQTGNVGTPNYLGMFTDATDLGNSVLYQSPTNAYLGVNTTAPLAPFHVAAPVAPAAFFDVYSPTLTALPVVYRAARGTPTAPSAVQTGDILGGLAVRGFGASVFSAGGRGQVAFLAAENWTDSAQGTALVFKTNPTGTAGAPLERLRVTPAGNVGIGTTTPGQLLSVAGTIESTTGGFKFPDGTLQTTAATTSAFSGNSAFGIGSLPANTGGANNTAFGSYTLTVNTDGGENTAIGAEALQANTTGGDNTASGTWALQTNTTGGSNTASGAYALYSNTSGNANTASGFGALDANTTGGDNTASGTGALQLNTTGTDNTATGSQALSSNTTGSWNTASGYQAGSLNVTGSNNTYVGNAAGPDAAHSALIYTTAIGSGAVVTQSNTLILGGASGTPAAVKVGIGTTTPEQTLSVAGTIESTSGGVKFPDGTLQTTAATVSASLGNSAFGISSLAANTTGSGNSAFGDDALSVNTTGGYNTASGYQALYANTTGYDNTATGYQALVANTTGNWNTATGFVALAANTTGAQNTATGAWALLSNTTGSDNTASGAGALGANTTGNSNTASGYQALYANTTGNSNTASGYQALYANTTGYDNTATGYQALAANAIGYQNTASGYQALSANKAGGYNTAFGDEALANTTGSSNIALGDQAGVELTTGNNNIDIGNEGVAGESNTIRIGSGQTRTFIAGIRGETTGSLGAIAVLVDQYGQLGTLSSSRRFKEDIADMAGASSGLMRLRPVTFHYKSDQNPAGRTLQYGLIAEEVAEVYPGLVAHSVDGQVETVLYQFLPPMLLNEYQKQQRTIETQQHAIETLQAQVEAGHAQIRRLTEQLAALAQAVAALSDHRQ